MARPRVPNTIDFKSNPFEMYLLLKSSKYTDAKVTLDNDPDLRRIIGLCKWYPSPYLNTSPTARMTSGNVLNLSRAVAAFYLPLEEDLYNVTLKVKSLDYRKENLLIHGGPKIEGFNGLPICDFTKTLNEFKVNKAEKTKNLKMMNEFIATDENRPEHKQDEMDAFELLKQAYELCNDNGEIVTMPEYMEFYNNKMKTLFNVK